MLAPAVPETARAMSPWAISCCDNRNRFCGTTLYIAHGPTMGPRGVPMRRKSSKTMIDIDRNVTVVHLNVGAGYVTYLQSDGKNAPPRVRAIPLEKEA